jgi:hypothetical protein
MISPLSKIEKTSYVQKIRALSSLIRPFAWGTNSSFNTAQLDPTIEQDPSTYLRSPLEEGNSWIFSDGPLFIKSTVVGRKTTTTPDGRFETVEVQLTYPKAEDFSPFTSYHYAAEGLIQRTVGDTVELQNEQGAPTGNFIVSRSTHTLIDSQP